MLTPNNIHDRTHRQGDVLLIRLTDAPGTIARPSNTVPKDAGRTVLAYGEVTGHSHAIASGKTTLFTELPTFDELMAKGGFSQDQIALFNLPNDRMMTVEEGEPATLVHEEHAAHTLPPGDYLVRIQTEYTPRGVRQVID